MTIRTNKMDRSKESNGNRVGVYGDVMVLVV